MITADDDDITPEERRAIRTLERLAKRWPKSLWLFSASGSLHVMKRGPDGERVMAKNNYMGRSIGNDELTDSRASIATIDIPNDGGDW